MVGRSAGIAAILCCALAVPFAFAQEVALSYTTAQAAEGRTLFERDCTICHGENLNDGPLGAPLKGDTFMRKFGGQSVQALFDVTRNTMPMSNPGSLTPTDVAALVAYILEQNDIVAGKTALPIEPATLAAMQVPAGGFSFMAYSPYTERQPVVRPNPIEDFEPVTDDAIAAPPPGDWLGWRRSYDAQGFSPLDDIDAHNVDKLRLAWSWTRS